MFSLLKTMQGAWRGHASDAGSIHGAELDLRDVESNGGGLQPGLHHFQRTGQNSSHCAATSRAKFNRVKEGKKKEEEESERKSMSGGKAKCDNALLYLGENGDEADDNKRNIRVNK